MVAYVKIAIKYLYGKSGSVIRQMTVRYSSVMNVIRQGMH